MLTLVISLVLFTALLLSYNLFMSGSQDVVMRESFETIGSHLALRISSVADLVSSHASYGAEIEELSTTVEIPITVANSGYTIKINETRILIEPTHPSPSNRAMIPMNISVGVVEREIGSGSGKIEIFYDTSIGKIDFR
jgi:hypothetical protein